VVDYSFETMLWKNIPATRLIRRAASSYRDLPGSGSQAAQCANDALVRKFHEPHDIVVKDELEDLLKEDGNLKGHRYS
jgi:hypothetical protein